jgi:hypothetical protein
MAVKMSGVANSRSNPRITPEILLRAVAHWDATAGEAPNRNDSPKASPTTSAIRIQATIGRGRRPEDGLFMKSGSERRKFQDWKKWIESTR